MVGTVGGGARFSLHITIEAAEGIRHVTNNDICRLRLAAQFLTTPGPSRANDVVRALGAVQSQDYAGAKWGLAQRVRGATDTSIEQEIDEGRILRTHVLRPTWHFVAAEDLRWMLELTAPRVNVANAHYSRHLGLDPKVFRRTNDIIAKALAGGKYLTRTELRLELERGRVKIPTAQTLGHIMMQAELDGVVCSGPRSGRQFTYALLDERAPASSRLERDAALLELTRRYFTTRSPATAHDFAWWSGLSVKDAKRGIGLASGEVERVTLGGEDFWIAAAAPAVRRSTRTVFLLPNYDEYFIGFRDRRAFGKRIGHTRPITGGTALIPHVIVSDGELIGAWRRVIETDRVRVSVSLMTSISDAEQKRLREAVRRFGAYLQSPVEIDA